MLHSVISKDNIMASTARDLSLWADRFNFGGLHQKHAQVSKLEHGYVWTLLVDGGKPRKSVARSCISCRSFLYTHFFRDWLQTLTEL
jgi:hypothetical protein